MTSREAIDRLNLMAKGGTNFSEKSNEACRMGAEALQEREERSEAVNSLIAMACCCIQGLQCYQCPRYINEKCTPWKDEDIITAVETLKGAEE